MAIHIECFNTIGLQHFKCLFSLSLQWHVYIISPTCEYRHLAQSHANTNIENISSYTDIISVLVQPYYTSQPAAFNGYLSTCGCLTGLKYKPQQKHSYLSTSGNDTLVISLVMELSIGDDIHSLPLCAYDDFWEIWLHFTLIGKL